MIRKKAADTTTCIELQFLISEEGKGSPGLEAL
jgi:hypothetical protein